MDSLCILTTCKSSTKSEIYCLWFGGIIVRIFKGQLLVIKMQKESIVRWRIKDNDRSTHSPILVTWNCFLNAESIFEFFEKTSNRPKAGPGPVWRFFEFCFLRWIHLINWWYLHESDDWSNVFQLTRADFALNFSIFNKKAFYISACQHFHFFKPAQSRL